MGAAKKSKKKKKKKVKGGSLGKWKLGTIQRTNEAGNGNMWINYGVVSGIRPAAETPGERAERKQGPQSAWTCEVSFLEDLQGAVLDGAHCCGQKRGWSVFGQGRWQRHKAQTAW